MISTSSKYAIKAVIYLCSFSNEENKLMVKNISDPINVPQPYIAKLLQKLSKQGIISSSRGPKGGFYLTKKNRERSVMDIIEAIEGSNKLNTCLLSLNNCNPSNPCPLHDKFYQVKNELNSIFEQTTIATLSRQLEEGKTNIPL